MIFEYNFITSSTFTLNQIILIFTFLTMKFSNICFSSLFLWFRIINSYNMSFDKISGFTMFVSSKHDFSTTTPKAIPHGSDDDHRLRRGGHHGHRHRSVVGLSSRHRLQTGRNAGQRWTASSARCGWVSVSRPVRIVSGTIAPRGRFTW